MGDRILSDVVLGNNLGMLTIYVEPLDTSRENFVVRTVRAFENKLLPRICPKDPPMQSLVSSDSLSDLVKPRPNQQ